MRADLRQGLAAAGRLGVRLLKGRPFRVFVVRSLGVGALFGLEVTLAQRLGAAGYGAFSFALAIATVVSRLAPLGWLNASTRLVSTYLSSGRLDLLKGSLILSHIATGVGLAVTALMLPLVRPSSGLFAGDEIVRYVLPLSFVLTLLELHRYVLRGLRAGDLGEALPVLALPAMVASSVLILGMREPGPVLYVYCAACSLLVLLSSAYITRRLPTPLWATASTFRSREWSLAALAMLLGATSDELVARTAVVMLGMLSTDDVVGVYQAAARLSLMNVFVLRALTPVAAPKISVLYHSGRLAELRSAYRRLCLLSFLGSLPFFLCFVAFPNVVLSAFGPDFVEGTWMLRVLSVGYLVSAASGPCATGLMMIGKERMYGSLALIAFLLNVLANYVLVHYAGSLGAAIATAIVVGSANLLYLTIFLAATR